MPIPPRFPPASDELLPPLLCPQALKAQEATSKAQMKASFLIRQNSLRVLLNAFPKFDALLGVSFF
jgi:hypothetical protein